MSDIAPLPRGRHRLSREVVKETQHRRLIHATLEEVGEQGYRRASVARIIRRAGVSRATFYEIFEDRAHCYRVSFEYLLSDLDRALAPASRPGAPEGAVAKLENLLQRLRDYPGRARAVFFASMVSCPEVAQLHLEATDRWSGWLDQACAGTSPARNEPDCIPVEQRRRMALGAALEVAFCEEAEPSDILAAAMIPYREVSAATGRAPDAAID